MNLIHSFEYNNAFNEGDWEMFNYKDARNEVSRETIFYLCSVYQMQLILNRNFKPEEWVNATKAINEQLKVFSKLIYENLLETNPELAKKVTTGVYEKDAISISEDIEKLYLTFYTPFESSILFDFHMKQLETKLYMDINEIFFYADGLVKNKFKTIEDLGEIELTFDSIKNYVYQKYIQKEDKIKQTMN